MAFLILLLLSLWKTSAEYLAWRNDMRDAPEDVALLGYIGLIVPGMYVTVTLGLLGAVLGYWRSDPSRQTARAGGDGHG